MPESSDPAYARLTHILETRGLWSRIAKWCAIAAAAASAVISVFVNETGALYFFAFLVVLFVSLHFRFQADARVARIERNALLERRAHLQRRVAATITKAAYDTVRSKYQALLDSSKEQAPVIEVGQRVVRACATDTHARGYPGGVWTPDGVVGWVEQNAEAAWRRDAAQGYLVRLAAVNDGLAGVLREAKALLPQNRADVLAMANEALKEHDVLRDDGVEPEAVASRPRAAPEAVSPYSAISTDALVVPSGEVLDMTEDLEADAPGG